MPGASPAKSPQKKSKGLSLSDSFKIQLQKCESIDLSSKNMGDQHINQICQLIRQHKYEKNLSKLDLSNNRIGDEGFLNLLKSICDSNV